MTIAPASQPPNLPALGEWQPLPTAGATTRDPKTAPSVTTLTRAQKILISIVATGAVAIAGIGFAGSYHAVTALAVEKGFGPFSRFFTLGIDIGIGIFLALDLLLTWLRMPYPLLRQGAWLLTAATISFNAAASWPDPLGVGMHAVIPILFVIAVEAARHAIGRIADITADKHIESPPVSRWLLAPFGTFTIWRRMRLWNIRSYETVIDLQRQVRVYRAQLRKDYGRKWRRMAPADKRLVLTLAADGMSIAEAIELPELEAKQRAQAEAKREAEAAARNEAEAEAQHQAELEAARNEANRRTEVARAEAAEAELRIETEAKQRTETEAGRILVAETEAKLAAIARAEAAARNEAELNRLKKAAEAAHLEAETKQQADEARKAVARKEREDRARVEAKRLAAEAATRSASGSGSGSTSKPDTVSGSGPRNIGGQRGKRQSEVEAVLALITEAGDPKAVSLEQVKTDFGLKQAAAWDRLSTARSIWTEANTKSA